MSILRQVTDAIQGKAPNGAKRSPQWEKVRNIYLKAHPFCAVCKATTKLEAHHIKPFHLYPELELDPNNLITLCETSNNGLICHLLIGHLGNYKSFNENVIADAEDWSLKLEKRP
jgi:hypothetical protein